MIINTFLLFFFLTTTTLSSGSATTSTPNGKEKVEIRKKKESSKTFPKRYTCNTLTGHCDYLPPPPSSPSSLSLGFKSLGSSSSSSYEQGVYEDVRLSYESYILRGQAQAVCLLTCGNGNIWPYPSGEVVLSSTVHTLGQFNLTIPQKMNEMSLHFYENLHAMKKSSSSKDGKGKEDGKLLYSSSQEMMELKVSVKDVANERITMQTDESYELIIADNEVTITAATIYGARHGLETLSQLIAYDPETDLYYIPTAATITDSPAFPYRGALLDTSRHFLPLDTIKKVIQALGYNKMNRLHLHLSDTASFPLEVPKEPRMTMYGAYDDESIYTPEDVAELVAFAKSYGVSIIPEVDTPSHVNEGWQWGNVDEINTFSICTTDWVHTALEPPAGHLNIANEAIYDVLRSIYGHMITAFDSPDLFHLGGDEIIVGSDETEIACWNSSTYGKPIIQKIEELGLSRDDPESFYKLWQDFTHQISAIVDEEYGTSSDALGKFILWGGAGGDKTVYNLIDRPDVTTVLPPSDYVIEVWDTSSSSISPKLLSEGYDIILANTDYVYFDCGQPGWVSPGGYWCNPYHEWYRVYEYISDVTTKWDLANQNYPGKIIGSETLLWGEENDQQNAIQKLWPRTAGLAEALWTNPSDGWYAADPRMQYWRNTLTSRGIAAEALQPKWCADNGAYACSMPYGSPQ